MTIQLDEQCHLAITFGFLHPQESFGNPDSVPMSANDRAQNAVRAYLGMQAWLQEPGNSGVTEDGRTWWTHPSMELIAEWCEDPTGRVL